MTRLLDMTDEQAVAFILSHPVSGGDDDSDNPAPQIQSAPATMDPSVLSGQPAMPTYTGPMGGDTGVAPTLGSDAQLQAPAAAAQASAPQVAPQGDGSAQNPIILPPKTADNSTGIMAPTNPGGKQSVWMNVVKGALFGMAAGAGTKNMGTGMSAGLAKQQEVQQQEVENLQKAKQLQFESVKAADSHIAAMDEHVRSQQLDQNSQLEYKQKSAEYQNFLQENFGVEPDLEFNDRPSQATAGLSTLSQQNGGTIPPVATVQQPSGKGWGTGNVAVYSPSTQQMKQNANGYRDLINTQRTVQGLPPIDDPTFNSMGFKGQRDAAQAAIEFMKPTPTYSLDKNKPDYLPNVLAQKQQQLQQYQNHKDVNGKPDADPNVEKTLQNGIGYLQNAWESGNKMENDAQVENIQATAPAKAASAALTAAAEAKAKQPYEIAKIKAEQAVKDGDPEAAGKLLASGDIAPSQIISSRQPAFAQKAFAAAKAASPNWNAQTAEGYFKVASAPQNVQFFGSAKSLTDPNGTLDQLQKQYNSLPNGQIPVLNKASDWVSAAAGKGPMAGFAQTAIGVADDYAKVMGGGQGSDTSRAQVLQSFAAAHSPEQMADAVNAARQAVDSQMNGRIGSNPVLKNMYGTNLLIYVQAPDGKSYPFRSQADADAFKKKAGIQ